MIVKKSERRKQEEIRKERESKHKRSKSRKKNIEKSSMKFVKMIKKQWKEWGLNP